MSDLILNHWLLLMEQRRKAMHRQYTALMKWNAIIDIKHQPYY